MATLPSVLPPTQSSGGALKETANILLYGTGKSADAKFWSVAAAAFANTQSQIDHIMSALRVPVGSLTTQGSTINIPGGSTPVSASTIVTGVSASEAGFSQIDSVLYDSLNVILTASTPAPYQITIWVDFGDGNGWTWQGIFSSISFALAVPASLNPAQVNWKIAAIGGIYGSAGGPPAGFVSASFTVTAAGACPANDLTNIALQTNPVSGDVFSYYRTDPGTYRFDLYELDWTVPTPTQDPFYWLSFFTVQKGFTSTGTCTISGGVNLTGGSGFSSGQVGFEIHVGGIRTTIAAFISSSAVTLSSAVTNGAGQSFEVWNQAPDFEGANEDPALAYWGRKISESRSLALPNSTTIKYRGEAPGNWGDPPVLTTTGASNSYRTYRVRFYLVSVLGQNATNPQPISSVFTLATGWSGSADHFDITPNAQPASLDLTRSLPATLGGTVAITGGLFGVAPASLSDTQITPGGISTPSLTTSSISVGGGGTKPIRFVVFNHSGVAIGWIGDDTANSGFVGAWFQELYVGDSGPSTAPFTVNASGQLSISMTSANAGATPFSLNLNGITTTITNTLDSSSGFFAGLKVQDGTSNDYSVVTPEGFAFIPGSGNYKINLFKTSSNTVLLQLSGSVLNSLFQVTINTAGTTSMSLQSGGATAPSISINGSQVLSTRVVTTPVTLADVIAVLQHHGLSN